jgi:hypothetical protein
MQTFKFAKHSMMTKTVHRKMRGKVTINLLKSGEIEKSQSEKIK